VLRRMNLALILSVIPVSPRPKALFEQWRQAKQTLIVRGEEVTQRLPGVVW